MQDRYRYARLPLYVLTFAFLIGHGGGGCPDNCDEPSEPAPRTAAPRTAAPRGCEGASQIHNWYEATGDCFEGAFSIYVTSASDDVCDGTVTLPPDGGSEPAELRADAIRFSFGNWACKFDGGAETVVCSDRMDKTLSCTTDLRLVLRPVPPAEDAGMTADAGRETDAGEDAALLDGATDATVEVSDGAVDPAADAAAPVPDTA